MNRRRYLALAAGSLGLAGCLSSGPSDSSPARHSDSPTQSPDAVSIDTPAPGTCDATPVPKPPTGEGLPDAKAYPDQPRPLDGPEVRAFVEAYETAHRHNSVLAEVAAGENCLKYLDVHVTERAVTPAGTGYEGEVTTRASFTGTHCSDVAGTDTPTPLPHADLAARTATYFVTDRFAIRNGVVVECFD